MPAITETETPILVWNGPGTAELSPKFLVPQEQQPLYPERWQFQPFNIAVYPNPTIENLAEGQTIIRDPIVDLTVDKLVKRLTADDLGNKNLEIPAEYWDKRKWNQLQNVPAQELPRAVIRPGTGQLDLLLDPLDYGKMPEPKPLFFYVSAVDSLPEEASDYHYSRRQLVRAAAQNGVIFQVDSDINKITGFWWMSMQGNHWVEYGPEEKLLDSVALRFCVHNGDTFVTDRSDYPQGTGEPIITWDQWNRLPTHHNLHEMAIQLHDEENQNHVFFS